MEKLIELLNEYEKGDVWSYDEEMGRPYYGWGDDCDYEAYLISKKYGFIKWLVENDKIDLGEKLFNLTKNDNRKSIIYDLDNNDFSWEDTFLMLLAIQDEPIRFLCEILK